MIEQRIPEPKNLLLQPDADTKKGLPDYTSDGHASDRVLRVNLGIFKYGTNDKTHAAAIMFSFLLFFAIIFVTILGFFPSHNQWADKVFNWLGSAFLFSLGIAFGSRGKEIIKKDVQE